MPSHSERLSGWHYASWRGRFFPEGLPLKQQLSHYARRFDTTELNGVFYRPPTAAAVSGCGNKVVRIHIRVESIEIHHALEAAVEPIGSQPLFI